MSLVELTLPEYQETIRQDRYYIRKDGKPAESSWEEVCRRVSKAVAQGEPKRVEQAFYEMLVNMYFVPGGRVLAAMGAPYRVTPYNCFVLSSPEDSREGIINRLREWIEIQALGGGVGINMSTLRPSGSIIKGVNGTSPRPSLLYYLMSGRGE